MAHFVSSATYNEGDYDNYVSRSKLTCIIMTPELFFYHVASQTIIFVRDPNFTSNYKTQRMCLATESQCPKVGKY